LTYKYFRDIMDVWDEILNEEHKDGKIESLLDGNGNILFFKKDGDIFGAGEDSRVVFAKLKNPDDDLPQGWTKEANFTADNLTRTIKGEPSRHVFNKDDLKDIKVMDRDEAFESLKNVANKVGDSTLPDRGPSIDKIIQIIRPHKDPDKAPNFVQADEED
jgi:hypothetical protein